MWTLIRTETRKLVTTRTPLVLAVVAVALPLLGATAMGFAGAEAGLDLAGDAAVQHDLLGAANAGVLAVILGVLVATSEHRHGTIIQTVLAVPSRWPALAAKAVVTALATVALTALMSGAALGGGLVAINAHGGELLLGADELVRTWALQALFATGLGFVGLGVGEAVRNQAVTLIAVLGVVLVVSPLVTAVAPSVGWYLPESLANALVQAPPAAPFGRLAAAGILGGYAAAALTAGAAVLTRRDLA